MYSSSQETRALGWLPHVRSAAATHRGTRARNEDAYVLDDELGFFAVADGMGGHHAGDVASRTAVWVLHGWIQAMTAKHGQPARLEAGKDRAREELASAFTHAAKAVLELGAEYGRSVGTTLSAIWIGSLGRLSIGHVGDSRVYLVRDGVPDVLTRDHNWAAEVARKYSDAEIPSTFDHVLTRAIGQEAVRPDVIGRILQPGDRVVLVTDGVYRVVSDFRIGQIVARSSVETAAEGLVRLALQLGTHDNATALVVEVR